MGILLGSISEFVYPLFNFLQHVAVEGELELTKRTDDQSAFLQFIYGPVGDFSTHRAGEIECFVFVFRIHEFNSSVLVFPDGIVLAEPFSGIMHPFKSPRHQKSNI